MNVITDIMVTERPFLGEYVPGTRFSEDILRDPPAAFSKYTSLLQGVMDLSQALIDKSYEEYASTFNLRLHAGQKASGTIDAGLRSSTLRLPERSSGSLLSVSL